MGDDKMPTQQTPEGETIPVPTKADVLRDMRKVAKAQPRKGTDTSDTGGSGSQE
jgi:hypothetical protein